LTFYLEDKIEEHNMEYRKVNKMTANCLKPTVICIDGIVGAGKSTVTRRLKDLYKCYEEPIEKWTLLPCLYNNMKEMAAPFQFQVLLSQYDQYTSFKNIHDTVIVERCPWTSKHVFTKMLMDDGFFDTSAFETYDNFYSRLAYDVDHFIFLEINAQLAFDRIKQRDRFAEQNISFEYLEKLQRQYQVCLKNRDPSTVTYVDGSKCADEVELEVRSAIEKVLKRPKTPKTSIVVNGQV
jgi:deoxyadenosine/deoxycytidine kinase